MNNLLPEFSMFITKSSLNNGTMKWSAVNSDVDWDLYGERMSVQLYEKMLGYIKESAPPPPAFKDMVCSDYWCGGMPYLSIAHYNDGNGVAVPGEPLELFIDGKQLKAKGVLFNTPLGTAVWKSLKADEQGLDENKIRISIAFLDLAHKHGDGGSTFHRKSLSDVCPECKSGKGEKIYLDGYLVHLALTRVPVNPRTIMEPEDVMAKKSKIETKKDDAISIIGEELTQEVEKSALETKSDVLIEMSDTEPLTEKMKDGEHKMDDSEDEEEGTEEDMKEDKKEKSLTAEDVAVIVAQEVAKALSATPVEAKSDTVSEPEVKKSALDVATEGLYNAVDGAIAMQGATVEERLASINPALQEIGNSITALVRESMGQSAPIPQSNVNGAAMEAINSLTEVVKSLATEVATMKAQSVQPSVPQANVMPKPRSIQPALVSQSQTQTTANPNSLTNIVRRSVSTQLPLK